MWGGGGFIQTNGADFVSPQSSVGEKKRRLGKGPFGRVARARVHSQKCWGRVDSQSGGAGDSRYYDKNQYSIATVTSLSCDTRIFFASQHGSDFLVLEAPLLCYMFYIVVGWLTGKLEAVQRIL